MLSAIATKTAKRANLLTKNLYDLMRMDFIWTFRMKFGIMMKIRHFKFDEWKRTVCPHEDMELAYEHLANISGMSAFRYIVEEFGGATKFPILSKYLPISNGGILPSEFAQQVFDELLNLEGEKSAETKIVLIEKSTNTLIASTNTDRYWFFVFTPYNKNTYGIDEEGFFILENVEEKGEEVSYVMFRSKNFIQQIISENCYRFIDIQSGNSFDCSSQLFPLEGDAVANYEFNVKTEYVKIAFEYEYIIEPLKLLIKASILSGNPIHWC